MISCLSFVVNRPGAKPFEPFGKAREAKFEGGDTGRRRNSSPKGASVQPPARNVTMAGLYRGFRRMQARGQILPLAGRKRRLYGLSASGAMRR
ncbi:MAG: hypothetical protein EBT43_04775 [Methylocystaceae bacterium]|nr:hypothetical protein [Methylocystaceae bacterium]